MTRKSNKGYDLDKDGNVEGGNIAVALSIIADKLPSSYDEFRTDHPLQGQTFGEIVEALNNIAEGLHAVATAIKSHGDPTL